MKYELSFISTELSNEETESYENYFRERELEEIRTVVWNENTCLRGLGSHHGYVLWKVGYLHVDFVSQS